uniref:SHSP domain-containing protein n=1 Tax=Heligmosomoides polygyrus TaxID=6339 RepID=A0A183GV06_HELPZ
LEKFYKEDHTFYNVIVCNCNANSKPRRSSEEHHTERDADHLTLHVKGNKEVVNDEKSVAHLSHFKPNHLKTHLDERDLTTEEHRGEKTKHGYIKKAFTYKWALPDDYGFDTVCTELDNGVC